MITKVDLKEAFLAGMRAAGRPIDGEASFEGWFQYYYTCTDCGQSTEDEQTHLCPARRGHPYREKP